MPNRICFHAGRCCVRFWERVFACPWQSSWHLGIRRRSPLLQAALPGLATVSAEDDQFLNDLEHASFLFFWEQGSPKTGMVKDRCNVHNETRNVASSIAATGFGLTALCIGEQRGFISTSAALERLFATLRFLWKKLPNHRGFFYHFANPETGERMFDSEVSSVDTAILLCGILTCRQHFRHRGVAELADLDLQPRRLDLAFGGHVPAHPRVDPGGWISFLALGLL